MFIRDYLGFPGGTVVKNPPANARDMALIPELERSPVVGNDNLRQYSWLENSMDRGPWWATVHGVAKSWTWLSNWARDNEAWTFQGSQCTLKKAAISFYRRLVNGAPHPESVLQNYAEKSDYGCCPWSVLPLRPLLFLFFPISFTSCINETQR